MPSWQQRADQSHLALERLANETVLRTAKAVHAAPGSRHQVLARMLWLGGRPAAAVAAQQGVATAEQLTGAARTDRDPGAVLADVESLAYGRELEAWRARGPVVQVTGDATRRWYRPSRSTRQDWTPVLGPREQAQQRVYRAGRAAWDSTAALADKLGVPMASAERGQPATWDAADPRLYEHYRQRVAAETARIAGDVVVDTQRAAMLDRLEEVGGRWVRKAEPSACGACLALADGRVRPASERGFRKHSRCRCMAVPVGANGETPPTGREMFDALTTDEQNALFDGRGGAAKAELLRNGDIDLADLVQVSANRAPEADGYVIGETGLADALQLVGERDIVRTARNATEYEMPVAITARSRTHWQVERGRTEILVADVQRTIERPTLVVPDRQRPGERRLFFAPREGRGWLRVVVDASDPSAPTVITAVRERRVPAWARPTT